MHIYLFMYVLTYLLTCIHTCIHIRLQAHQANHIQCRVWTYLYSDFLCIMIVNSSLQSYTCVYPCICTYIYMYIYMYTYIYTHTQPNLMKHTHFSALSFIMQTHILHTYTYTVTGACVHSCAGSFDTATGACKYAYTSIHFHIHPSIHPSVHPSMHACMHDACILTHIHACMYACMYVCMYARIYVCVCVCASVCIQDAHTLPHIQRERGCERMPESLYSICACLHVDTYRHRFMHTLYMHPYVHSCAYGYAHS